MKVRLKFKPKLKGSIGRYKFKNEHYRDFHTKKKASKVIKKILREKPETKIILSQVKHFKNEVKIYPLEIYEISKEKITKKPYFNIR